jgi:hypothetical protein
MKAIIDGKRYNTEKATEVASHSEGYASDHCHFEEALYVTSKGTWFLAGEGGAMSHYSVSTGDGNTRGGGAHIRPLTATEAREWLEQHDEVDALEKHFGDQLEDA